MAALHGPIPEEGERRAVEKSAWRMVNGEWRMVESSEW
jgi:hypothetical protein